ncbi:UNVERIFIED_CONTAM: hypothetical protein GTU68_038025 [Idotea baltica]|nr:hypothetical protein [Idotea baltica]
MSPPFAPDSLASTLLSWTLPRSVAPA